MAKALLIVEGAGLEPRFFSRMAEIAGMEVEIVSLRANIYLLYRKLEEYGFDYDIKSALRELIHTEEADAVLAQRFAYTYLIFDCDAHDSGQPKAGQPRAALPQVVSENYDRLREMVAYFTDETDPDRGKLYVNYPMMESYRDCDAFFDETFRDRVVSFEDLPAYKRKVGCRRLANCRMDELGARELGLLARMNLFKLSVLLGRGWGLPPFAEYVKIQTSQVLAAQRTLEPRCEMSVINTSLFLYVDYFGDMAHYPVEEATT